MSDAVIELTFLKEQKRFSEKILIFRGSEQIGYSLRGQYVRHGARRYPLVIEKKGFALTKRQPDFRIYYTPKEYACLVSYTNSYYTADGRMQYKNTVYTISRLFSTWMYMHKDSVKIYKGEEAIAEMFPDKRKNLFSRVSDNGTIRFYTSPSDTEEFGMLLAMLFAGKDCFDPEREAG